MEDEKKKHIIFLICFVLVFSSIEPEENIFIASALFLFLICFLTRFYLFPIIVLICFLITFNFYPVEGFKFSIKRPFNRNSNSKKSTTTTDSTTTDSTTTDSTTTDSTTTDSKKKESETNLETKPETNLETKPGSGTDATITEKIDLLVQSVNSIQKQLS